MLALLSFNSIAEEDPAKQAVDVVFAQSGSCACAPRCY
jgi:hypothetical protein